MSARSVMSFITLRTAVPSLPCKAKPASFNAAKPIMVRWPRDRLSNGSFGTGLRSPAKSCWLLTIGAAAVATCGAAADATCGAGGSVTPDIPIRAKSASFAVSPAKAPSMPKRSMSSCVSAYAIFRSYLNIPKPCGPMPMPNEPAALR